MTDLNSKIQTGKPQDKKTPFRQQGICKEKSKIKRDLRDMYTITIYGVNWVLIWTNKKWDHEGNRKTNWMFDDFKVFYNYFLGMMMV